MLGHGDLSDKGADSDTLSSASYHYEEWFERAPVGYFVLDRGGVILTTNHAGLTMIGWPREQVVGKSFSDFVDKEDRGHFSLHLYEVTKTAQTAICELCLEDKDGKHLDVELHSTSSSESQGKRPAGCFMVVSDISARRNMEQQLRDQFSELERRRLRGQTDLERSGNLLQQEVFNHEQTEAILAQTSELFEKVFSTSYLAIACLDRDFNFIRVNPAYAQVYGESPTFFLDKPYFDLYPNDELKASFAEVLATGEPYSTFAVPFLTMEGDVETMTWWDWNVSTLVDRDGRPEGLLLCLVDVSLRVKLERKIVSVTEQEQKRLGQELHDGMGQLLTAISIKAKILEEIIAETTPGVVPHVREVEEMLREATVQTRDLSKLLNPHIVAAQGLGPALKSLAAETQRRLGVRCDFTWDEDLEPLDPVVAGHLFRIAQEAVTNALRHGQARSIQIALVQEDGDRVLRIANEGNAFNPKKAEESDGLGIRGMRYRAEMIGADCQIVAGLIDGAVVRCVLPEPEVALDVSTEVD